MFDMFYDNVPFSITRHFAGIVVNQLSIHCLTVHIIILFVPGFLLGHSLHSETRTL